MFHGRLHPTRRPGFDGSRLRYATKSTPQRQAAVKLHRDFASLRGALGCAPVNPGSAGPGRGQRGPRYSVHASRQLSGKVLRYLKRVRVTPAVYRPFLRLYPAFRYRHWAGVGGCTNPFGLAATYVFVKQSGPPSHCDLPVNRAGTPSPEVTGLICRVPSPGLHPTRLSLLSQGTCVGSRYGHPRHHFPRPFSRAPGIGRTLLTEGPSRLRPVLAITALPGLQRLDTAATVLGLSRGVRPRARHRGRGPNINGPPASPRSGKARLRAA